MGDGREMSMDDVSSPQDANVPLGNPGRGDCPLQRHNDGLLSCFFAYTHE